MYLCTLPKLRSAIFQSILPCCAFTHSVYIQGVQRRDVGRRATLRIHVPNKLCAGLRFGCHTDHCGAVGGMACAVRLDRHKRRRPAQRRAL